MWDLGLVQKLFKGKETSADVMTKQEVNIWTRALVVRMENTKYVYKMYLYKT